MEKEDNVKSIVRNFFRSFVRLILKISRPLDERWMYDQFIPIQSVNRSILEYNVKYYGRNEFYRPPEIEMLEAEDQRELLLHYQPVAIPKPYYFFINDAVVYGPIVVALDNPNRVFLETYAEVSSFVEDSNHTDNRISRWAAKRYGERSVYDLDKSYFFTTRLSYNYYHFIFDACLRFIDLEEQGAVCPETKLLFHSELNSWQQQILDLLGIPKDRIVVVGNKKFKIRKLVISSSRRQRFAVSKSAISSFVDRIMENSKIVRPQQQRRIFISRARARSRRLKNEKDLASELKKFGFDIYYLEEMSFLEQVTLFSSAEFIIGPHGAGLSNMIFSENPIVCELFPYDYWGWGYYIPLTYAIGGKHHIILGDKRGGSSSEDFSVDIDKVVKLVSSYVS